MSVCMKSYLFEKHLCLYEIYIVYTYYIQRESKKERTRLLGVTYHAASRT